VQGKGDEAEAHGSRAAEIGQQFGVPDLEMLGLALRGSVLVSRALIEEGMRCLDEATTMALAGEANIPISCAWTCCFLVSACTSSLDLQRAFEWCDRIAEFSQRYGSRYMLAFCRAEYGTIFLWRGQWSQAEQMLESSVQDFTHSRPAMVSSPLLALAELRRRQGRTEEAEGLIDRVGAGPRASLIRARLAMDRGEPRRSIEIVDRLLRQLPAHDQLARIPALELLVRVRLAVGDTDAAATALRELRQLQQTIGTLPMQATGDRAAGMFAAAAGELGQGRSLLEDAVDGFCRSGAPFEEAVTRIELASALRAAGDLAAARQELGRARRQLSKLGAQGEAARAGRLMAELPGRVGRRMGQLTPRERAVLGILALGLTNQQIGERLGISEHTVHRHVTNILRKLELPSRAAAAARAAHFGLGPVGGAP